MIKQRAFPLEVKAVDGDTGEFSGYLSVFGNTDSYREVVMPGAFTKSLDVWGSKGKLPPILWQHNPAEPLGPFTKMTQDDHGLHVEGRLLISDLQRAREAHALLKAGVISGLSIGFETVGQKFDKDARVTQLTELKLWEGSVVTFPANEAAQIDAVKGLLDQGELPTLKEFEKFLREAGFSKTQAAAIAGKGLAHLLRSESGETAKDELADILAAIKSAPSRA